MKATNLLQNWGQLNKSLMVVLFGMAALLMVSCNNDETPGFSEEDTESASIDALEDSYFDDADDLAAVGFTSTDDSFSGGKINTDERLACAVLTRTGERSNGSLRIDFGTGCTGPGGNVRTGAIVIVHEGAWNEAGSSWSITFDNYSINGIKIAGTREVTVVSFANNLSVYDVTLIGGSITWPDGRTATREVSRRREHERNENNLLDRLIIYGTAEGISRRGRGYSVEIVERLIYTRACAAEGVIIPVSGVKVIKHGNNRELTVDYGDGTCDNFVTLTNQFGRSVRYEVKK